MTNNIESVITSINQASQSSTSLTDMLAICANVLNNTTAVTYNNAARRYLLDFSRRPTIPSVAENVVYVDQFLFDAGQIGAGSTVITTADRIIFKTIQAAMDYIGSSTQPYSWNVVINQAFYNENITIPAGRDITMTGVSGVVIGNGQGDQFSYSPAPATPPPTPVVAIMYWNLNDSQNLPGVTPSLKIQAAAYGCSTYRQFGYFSMFFIGNFFYTQITGPITSSPKLEFDSVYVWSGTSVQSDIGPLQMTLHNYRTGGVANWTSATLQDVDTMLQTQVVTVGTINNMTNTVFYRPWTVSQITGMIKDSAFSNAGSAPLGVFTVTQPPNVLPLNSSANYWFTNNLGSALPPTSVWTLGIGTSISVDPNQ